MISKVNGRQARSRTHPQHLHRRFVGVRRFRFPCYGGAGTYWSF